MPPPPLHQQVATIPLGIEQVVLKALAKDPKERFASVQEFASALEQADQIDPFQPALFSREQPASALTAPSTYATTPVPTNELTTPTGPNPPAESPPELATPPSQVADDQPPPHQFIALQPAVAQLPADAPRFPHPLKPIITVRQRAAELSGITKGLLIGMIVLVIAAGVLGSLSLLTHFGVLGAHSGTTTAVVRGGTWTDDIWAEPDSLLPNGSGTPFAPMIDNALYLPLFYGDAQGVIHPGAASEVPSLGNGGISADAATWTFHLRPHLVWSDGEPYDARDVDYTWQLWRNPKFEASNTPGLNLITSADVSADHLSITFHLKQPFAPFLSFWVDGFMAPLPAHHFRALAPEAIKQSPDNLNPTVTSGPFLMAENKIGDHYTLMRNPRYYRAHEGLPHLDKVVFRIVSLDTILHDLQAGTITSAWFLDPSEAQAYQRLTPYMLVTPPASAAFEGMYFNFHNTVLASHPEVRQAIAMAIDHQALIQMALHGLATPLCTDHGSFYHPGYEVLAPCPEFNPTAANKLLADNGWVKGPDGVRTRGSQRLEFEYSTSANNGWRSATEAILQRDFQAIGIKLDIQNYPGKTFFGPFLTGGKASPPTGALAGSYDIAEFKNVYSYDPDDSSLLSCDQIPPNGYNVDFYCNHALDALYRQELATADSGLRQQLFGQIHEIYLTAFPFITLFGAPNIAMLRKGTHNYQMSDVEGGTVNIWEWWCDNGKC
ncbi:MAG: ABC transporter substrate-binding protein [Ktedonobacteraceae bacterium]